MPVVFAPQMAEEVLNLIHEKEKVISQFPGELFGYALDAGYTEINFNGKCCYGYALSCCSEGEEICFWVDVILCCIKRYGYYSSLKGVIYG